MRFSWDDKKNLANINKHGIAFMEAGKVFNGPVYTYPDEKQDYAEPRRIAIGLMDTRLVTVVFVERGDELVRIISARRANTLERRPYEQNVGCG
ncbi:BrnT family toxin [Pseudoduganella sp. LjRoot289]|uniref:BrnT family toxin n=1 Tax=Pseudoduganella sp. LjRoot289 TaxID=3342314 RepID=UPI003ECCD42B